MKRTLQVLSALSLGSCSVMMPANDESQLIRGERVTLELISISDLDKTEYAPILAARNSVFPQSGAKSIAAAAGVAAAELAVDFLVDAIEEEQDSYTAQYSGRIASGSFWECASTNATETTWDLHHGAFVLKRYAGDSDTPHFTIYCGMALSDDQQAVLVAPLIVESGGSKAKILTTRWWSWLPVFWWHYLLDAGETVDREINIEMVSATANGPKKNGAAKIALPQTPLTKTIGVGSGLPTSPSTLILPVPIPKTAPKVVGKTAGSFSLTVTVTEKDPSNAATAIKKFNELVSENKSDIIKLVAPDADK